MKLSVLWLRNDLRLRNHPGLWEACKSGFPVLPLFIFDQNILTDLPQDDARVSYIHQTLQKMHEYLRSLGSSIYVVQGRPHEVWQRLLQDYEIAEVYMAEDYEPHSRERDSEISEMLESRGIKVHTQQNKVICHPTEILKNDGTPYSVYTPYAKKWKSELAKRDIAPAKISKSLLAQSLFTIQLHFPSLESLGFIKSQITVPQYDISSELLSHYAETRDIPSLATSYLSTYLRFGVVDISSVYQQVQNYDTYLGELIWREFFKQILYHYPAVVHEEFKPKYRGMPWRQDEADFLRWQQGLTGYPIVDAGMRELTATGLMHNRVRMITASFLVKHLLIDWRWGEAYFAEKLLDYDLSANNGNWQWVAGTGCDAAPYFRVFNPTSQQQKFDPEHKYIKKWVPEYGTTDYPQPMVDHKMARQRALDFYKAHLEV